MNFLQDLLLLFLAVLLGATATAAPAHDGSRRCVVDIPNSRRIALSSTCESCSTRQPSSDDLPQIMIVVAAEAPTTSPMLTIASQLLASRVHVVIVRVTDDSSVKEDTEAAMRNKIMSYTSCGAEAQLTFKWVSVQGINGNIPFRSSPYEALSKAEAVYHALSWMDEHPNVMVVSFL